MSLLGYKSLGSDTIPAPYKNEDKTLVKQENKIKDGNLHVDAQSILFMRNCGSKGYPGSAEVVNILPPNRLVKQDAIALLTVGNGRQSGTCAYVRHLLKGWPMVLV